MRERIVFSALCILFAAGCSNSDDAADKSALAEGANVNDVAASSDASASTEVMSRAPIPAKMPQIAYTFGLAFEAPAPDVGKLMRRHADLCEQQGPQSCRIVGMDLTGDARREDVAGKLQLAVVAPHARALTALLEKEATGIGAEQVATTIDSEEVTKTIVDTQARIRSREELRSRLTEILRTKTGSVRELVETERQVAAVNEEIDQARSWLEENRGRVAFSRMDIDYRSETAAGSAFLAPVAAAVGSLGSVLGFVIAALLLAAAVLGPIAAVAWAVRRINCRLSATRTEV